MCVCVCLCEMGGRGDEGAGGEEWKEGGLERMNVCVTCKRAVS